MCGKNSAETGHEGRVHGDRDSPRSSLSSADLRLRENLADHICAESRSRPCRAGVRAPSAEFNWTRIPAFARACAYVEILHCCTARWCALTGPARNPPPPPESKMKLHAHLSKVQFSGDCKEKKSKMEMFCCPVAQPVRLNVFPSQETCRNERNAVKKQSDKRQF